jgi:hypothetical protein
VNGSLFKLRPYLLRKKNRVPNLWISMGLLIHPSKDASAFSGTTKMSRDLVGFVARTTFYAGDETGTNPAPNLKPYFIRENYQVANKTSYFLDVVENRYRPAAIADLGPDFPREALPVLQKMVRTFSNVLFPFTMHPWGKETQFLIEWTYSQETGRLTVLQMKPIKHRVHSGATQNRILKRIPEDLKRLLTPEINSPVQKALQNSELYKKGLTLFDNYFRLNFSLDPPTGHSPIEYVPFYIFKVDGEIVILIGSDNHSVEGPSIIPFFRNLGFQSIHPLISGRLTLSGSVWKDHIKLENIQLDRTQSHSDLFEVPYAKIGTDDVEKILNAVLFTPAMQLSESLILQTTGGIAPQIRALLEQNARTHWLEELTEKLPPSLQIINR